jgi:hypothetical protein
VHDWTQTLLVHVPPAQVLGPQLTTVPGQFWDAMLPQFLPEHARPLSIQGLTTTSAVSLETWPSASVIVSPTMYRPVDRYTCETLSPFPADPSPKSQT